MNIVDVTSSASHSSTCKNLHVDEQPPAAVLDNAVMNQSRSAHVCVVVSGYGNWRTVDELGDESCVAVRA
jgi:hypothetical protein